MKVSLWRPIVVGFSCLGRYVRQLGVGEELQNCKPVFLVKDMCRNMHRVEGMCKLTVCIIVHTRTVQKWSIFGDGGSLTSSCKYARAFTNSLQKKIFCLESNVNLLIFSVFHNFLKFLFFSNEISRKNNAEGIKKVRKNNENAHLIYELSCPQT